MEHVKRDALHLGLALRDVRTDHLLCAGDVLCEDRRQDFSMLPVGGIYTGCLRKIQAADDPDAL